MEMGLRINGGEIVFEQGFPCDLKEIVHKVLGVISSKTYNDISFGYVDVDNNEEYLLLDGSTICFPYRIYFIDDDNVYNELTSMEEKCIYDCIFTRSDDGYVRQKHLVNMLIDDMPEWCMPYILKLSSEYVEEIVGDIYNFMESRDNNLFQVFCERNPYMFRYAYSRMTSYWNEFYRGKCYIFHNYIGYKLFKDCFGYSRRFDDFNR